MMALVYLYTIITNAVILGRLLWVSVSGRTLSPEGGLVLLIVLLLNGAVICCALYREMK